MKKFLVLDVFNLMFRAYHALPKTFTDKEGNPTNAIYGVTSMLINMLNQIKPQYVLAALDSAEAPTFRSEGFTAYKAHRKPMEEDLESQISKIREVLSAFGIAQLQLDGYEADDIVATAVTKFKNEVEMVVVSNDRDLWQLASKTVLIMLPNTKGDTQWLSEAEVSARLGFSPQTIADYKGLRGDPSDNIPGVHGIGEKTATKLLQEYGSLENIYIKIDSVMPHSLREKLLENYEQALMSKKLAQLIYDVPFTLALSECKYSDFNKIKVKHLLEKYNFKSLIRRLGFEVVENTKKSTGSSSSAVNMNQPALF